MTKHIIDQWPSAPAALPLALQEEFVARATQLLQEPGGVSALLRTVETRSYPREATGRRLHWKA